MAKEREMAKTPKERGRAREMGRIPTGTENTMGRIPRAREREMEKMERMERIPRARGMARLPKVLGQLARLQQSSLSRRQLQHHL